MITINEIKIDEKNYLTGKIGKENYSIESTAIAKEKLTAFQKKVANSETFEEVQDMIEQAQDAIKAFKVAESDELKEVLADDLYHNEKADTYHIKVDGTIGKKPVHAFFVTKMKEAHDKTLSPKPWLIFWVRLMRNPLYKNDAAKVDVLVNFLKAQYTNKKNVTKLMEEDGFSEEIAKKLSTHDQISITEEGILASFKYVSLVTDKYIVEKDEETGNQVIKRKDRYERTLEVDDVTGEVTKDELDLPKFSEDLVFVPPIMGKGGDAFSCRDLAEDVGTNPGHIVKIGMIHELPNFDHVNCNDSRSGVKGLHLGGYYYVEGFGGKTNYLVDCLVAPEDIGAVCDTDNWRESEGAIRTKRYMVIGGHEMINRGMYHPSKYAKMLDHEWAQAKKDAIEELLQKIEDTQNSF